MSNREEKAAAENTFATSEKSWLFVTDLFIKHQRAFTCFRLAGLDPSVILKEQFYIFLLKKKTQVFFIIKYCEILLKKML